MCCCLEDFELSSYGEAKLFTSCRVRGFEGAVVEPQKLLEAESRHPHFVLNILGNCFSVWVLYGVSPPCLVSPCVYLTSISHFSLLIFLRWLFFVYSFVSDCVCASAMCNLLAQDLKAFAEWEFMECLLIGQRTAFLLRAPCISFICSFRAQCAIPSSPRFGKMV